MSNMEFRPIPNPYIVGNPIKDPKLFFGREDDFLYVQKKFSGGKEGGMIVLCGARRSGKTSVLFQILNGRLGGDFLPVLIDMQSMAIRDDRDLLGKLAHEVIGAVNNPEITIDDYRAEAGDNPFTAFENLVRKINGALDYRKLVFMFDEYELFETNIDSGIISPNVLNLLGNLIEHKKVFIVFTGSDNLEARDKPYWDVFLSKALHRRISFLSKGDTLRLMHRPVEEYVRYGETVPEAIFALTAGQPFYTQVLCQSIVDHLNEYRRNDVRPDDVRQVVDEIIENPLPQMIFSWNAHTHLEKLALSIIAELSREEPKSIAPKEIIDFAEREHIGYSLDINELNKALESLFHGDVLDKEADADAYRFKMDLWRLWVSRMHSVWQTIDEIEHSEEGAIGKGISSQAAATRRKRRILFAAGAAAVIIAVLLYGLSTRRGAGGMAEAVDMAILTVQTNPGQANVFVDGKWIGASPVTEAEVAASSKTLKLELAGYRTVVDSMSLEKDKLKELSYELAELAGSLRITSEPPGASIAIDGKRTELVTPAVVNDLSANAIHRVEMSLAGYNAGVRDGIRIASDSTITVSHSFSKMSGSLSIGSQPVEAEAYLDGALVGTTPCIGEGLAYGRHELKVAKAGYRTYAQGVDISKPKDKIDVALSILPPGKIVFSIEPYGSVSINGRVVKEDATYYEAELPPGRYAIILQHPKFAAHTEEIEVKSNESVTIRHRFSN
jgi:AAA+ ATPase superfamily predicted ATPase